MKFKELGIIEPVLKSIEEQHFEEPSEIQLKAIPRVMQGHDVIAKSATGSGKTLVFAAGVIKNTVRGKGLQALILTPTRELANQVAGELAKFAKHSPLKIITVYGGVSINPQIEKLAYADVVVGTPGRILDHMQRKTIDLKHVKTLVLDEADRMLDMGFIEDVDRILSQCPRQRQTMLFSATMPSEISTLSRKYMKEPVKVEAESFVDPAKLKQLYYDVDDKLKFSLLAQLLNTEKEGLVMVFTNTRMNTDFIELNLKNLGFNAVGIHGGCSQEKRNNIMKDFNSGKAAILVCTDVAARGLDIKGVSHVYNYDIPKDSKEYIHRIGRTARAGKEGKVVNLISSRDHDSFSRVVREIRIPKEETPYVQRVQILTAKNRGFRGHGRPGADRFQRRDGRGQRFPPRQHGRN